MKDGSSLVVTPSIPSFATRGPDEDLSSNERFEEVLVDSKDEPVMKTRVSEYDEDDDNSEQEIEAIGMCLLSLANILFLFFLSFLGAIF